MSRAARVTWGALAVLALVVVAAAAGWFGAELHDRQSSSSSSTSTPAPSSTVPAPQEGSALTSVSAKTVISRALGQVRAGKAVAARLPDGIDAAAVQVTVTDAERAGAVRLDAGAGPTTALTVATPGTTTTNLVVLPVSRRELVVRHGPGGGLTVRVVGTFGAAADTDAGRFVASPPVQVAHLDTAEDGRELTIPPERYGAGPGIRAVLVLVAAEVGDVPARLLVGREPATIGERMAWGGAVDGNTQRRGLALVPVNEAGEFSLRYEHGTALDVSVLGWFTGPGAPADRGALLVPEAARTVYDGPVSGGADVAVPADATGALLNLAAEPGQAGDLPPSDVAIASGRTLAVVLDAEDGRVRLQARAPIEARIDLMGWFVEE